MTCPVTYLNPVSHASIFLENIVLFVYRSILSINYRILLICILLMSDDLFTMFVTVLEFYIKL